MTKEEAVQAIERCGLRTVRSVRPSDNPERTRALLDALGSPQRQLKFIHVCGSNGKGSVCAMLDAVLRASGRRVGLFTSPHVQDFCERMCVDGSMISEEELSAACDRVLPLASRMDGQIGYFCLVTAMAIDWFARRGCDIVILEAGIGGRYDATNAIDAPELAVVTSIGLDHTEILGETPAQIARDKAGIVKPGCLCAARDNGPEVNEVLRAVCDEQHVPLTLSEDRDMTVLPDDAADSEDGPPGGQILTWRGRRYRLSLTGSFQAENAALALTAIDLLRQHGWPVSEEAVQKGLSSVRWPARLEIISRHPLIVLDGGHNPSCAAAVSEAVRTLFGGQRFLLLTGMMRDKKVRETLALLVPRAEEVYCVEPDGGRGLSADETAALVRELGGTALVFRSVKDSLDAAVSSAGARHLPLLIFGSLYLAGEIRNLRKLMR